MDGSSYERRRRRMNHDYSQDNEGIDGNNNRRSIGDNDLLDHDHEYEYEHDNENCIISAFFNYLFRNVRSGNIDTFPYLLLGLICSFIPITIMMDSSPIHFLDYLLILLRSFFTHLLFYFLILPILTILFLSTISFTFF